MTGPDPNSHTASGARAARLEHGTDSAVRSLVARLRAGKYRQDGHIGAADYWAAYAQQMAELEADQ